MATIALYAGKLQKMPGLINAVRASVNDYQAQLFALKGKALTVNSGICPMDDVVHSLQSSAQTQERKADSLDGIRQGMEEFASDTAAIDSDAAEIVRQRKEDFYKQYAWLKPECEKNGWERLRGGLKSAGEWCREHWKLVVTAVAAVVTVVLCICFPAVIPFVVAIVKGALIGALTGGLMGGVVNLLLGESFWEGFWDGAFWGAVFGGIGGAGRAFAGCCKLIQALGGFEKVFRVITRVAKISGTLSMAMGGFDLLSLAVRLFDPSHPLVVFNEKLHSCWLYNGFQFVVGAVAAFSSSAYLRMKQGPPVCFVAGTMILTASGLTAIENIRAGDKVISTDPDTFLTEEKSVVETYVRETRRLVHLRLGGELVSTTVNHPFWVTGRGFVSAGELQMGDVLLTAAGEGCRVENIRLEIVEKPERVYNFQVEEFHTYHVGSSGVLVHNADYGVEGGTPTKVTSNLGNEIDITPSDNHTITTKNPGLKGTPNSSIDIVDSAGNIKTRRWFDSDGIQMRDVDFTNHGNAKLHPEWPHEHGTR